MSKGSSTKTAEASALLARGSGYLNLQLIKRKLSRAGLREVALWARRAADLLDTAAGLDAPAGQGLVSSHKGRLLMGEHDGTGEASGESGA